MATTALNVANCGNTTNVGSNGCNLVPGIIKYAVAIPKGTVIPASNLTSAASFLTFFKSKFTADARSGRFYLSPLLTNFDDKTGDAVTESRDNFEATVQNKPYNWGWHLNPAGNNFCDYRNWFNLVNFQQGQYDFLFIDDIGQVWGTAALDSTGAQGLGGYAMFEIFVQNWTPKTASALAKYMLRLKFLNNIQIVQNAAFIAASAFPDNTWGLVGVTLAQGATTNTTTLLYLTGTMGCGASTLGSVYGATLAAAGAWVLTKASAPLTPSAVAYDAVNDQYKFTITALTTGDIVTFKLAAPSVVDATPYFANIISETVFTYVAP
jgi:hypothetical protein